MKIVSGGQTGVDRAALDVALELALPCGGWCPRGRKAEDGSIPARYPLTETRSADYAQRTEWNVRDADATLVLTRGQPSGGTALTIDVAQRLGKPCLVIDLDGAPNVDAVRSWIQSENVGILNVAGPRESQSPGIHAAATGFLRRLFS
jgi:Circularly permutated YpsA SLOG family